MQRIHFIGVLTLLLAACGSNGTSSNAGVGGSTSIAQSGSGGASTGGLTSSLVTSGGNGQGGKATGGVFAAGGSSTGGLATGAGGSAATTATGGTNATGGTTSTTGGTTSATGGATTGGTGPSACDESMAAWKSSDLFAKHPFGIHTLRNNVWGSDRPGYVAGQAIWAVSERCWGVNASHLNGTGLVKAYPNDLRGWAIGDGILNPAGGLPIKLSLLTKARIYWKMSVPTDGRFMALWDIYFHMTASPGPEQLSHTNLQIFQRIADSDGYFRGEAAKGQSKTYGGIPFKMLFSAGSTMSGTNAVITLYMGPNDVNPMGAEEKLFDLKAMIDDMIADGVLDPSLYLTSIQNGWEIIIGTRFKTLDYWSALQNDPEG